MKAKPPKITPQQAADTLGCSVEAYQQVKHLTLNQMVSLGYLMGGTLTVKLEPRPARRKPRGSK